jgi:hypothetical protein
MLEIARYNSTVYEVENRIPFQQADIQSDTLPPGAAFFLDPARAGERPSKTRSLFNTEPPLDSVLPYLLEHIPHGGVKISPAFDYTELNHLPQTPEVEIIGYRKHNAVAMLWFGYLARHRRKGCVLFEDDSSYEITDDTSIPNPPLSTPQAFLCEPHPALRKAHVISEVANVYGMSQIDVNLAFLTTSDLPQDTRPFRVFQVHTVQRFSWAQVHESISTYNLERAEIMTRAFPHSPEEIRAQLHLAEGSPFTLLFTTLQNTLVCILLERRSSYGKQA